MIRVCSINFFAAHRKCFALVYDDKTKQHRTIAVPEIDKALSVNDIIKRIEDERKEPKPS